MTIQPNSATDNAAQLAAQAFTNPKQNQAATPSSADSTSAQVWNKVAASDSEEGSDIDGATADQLTQQLAKSMLNNAATALNAQSGANPQSTLDLLQ
jgi:hypothetical protein